MSDEYEIDKRNKVRQLCDKAKYDRETVHRILDACMIAHVAFVQDDQPIVVPMICVRDGESVYLHGARKARVIKLLEKNDQVCLNATLVDGLVLARSAFNSSMQYRSVTLFGTPTLLESEKDKLHAMRCISEHLMPGRWNELRAPLEKEIKMTGVIEVPIARASAKVSAGPPKDEPEDYDIPIWAGVLPLTQTLGTIVSDDQLLPGVQPSPIVLAMQNRKL
ncbi:MAG: pyridoxamine 5'-phosphate oxidase family protein [Woeseia sp.]|nr:pyridoxamine 5'-phosphate oxidase family protein [Woeseia sp.]NNE59928.1 pyridoxamine 5'-phosphate oxidase family protein [Woeseia sp.]NNL53956.1 pyridoxamine 5'-phosphate oxidase family protein [Woeseia sp.]